MIGVEAISSVKCRCGVIKLTGQLTGSNTNCHLVRWSYICWSWFSFNYIRYGPVPFSRANGVGLCLTGLMWCDIMIKMSSSLVQKGVFSFSFFFCVCASFKKILCQIQDDSTVLLEPILDSNAQIQFQPLICFPMHPHLRNAVIAWSLILKSYCRVEKSERIKLTISLLL